MRTSIFIVSSTVLAVSMTFAVADTVTDPVQAYAKLDKLSAGRVIYEWSVDLNRDGRKEILLAAQDTPEEQEEESKEEGPHSRGHNDMLSFDVYIPNSHGPGYLLSKGTDFGTYFGLGTALSVDLDRCYVGKITQLNKWGVVSVQLVDGDEKNAAGAVVFAYTLEGEHLKVTDLARYDPGKGSNAIYDQYLSDAHRTSIKLQEITLP